MLDHDGYFARPTAPRLFFDDTGGSGIPVVFQHGLCGNAAQPREVFPADPSLRRVTVECRGHGASEAGDLAAFSIATFADDVAAVIENLGLGRVVIGGISMGAAIAMHLAVKRPNLVRGLIIARPAWACSAAPENNKPNAEVGELLNRLPPKQALAQFQQSATAKMLSAEGPDNLATLLSFFRREPVSVTSALLCAIAADGPGVTESEMKSLRIPTLVIGHGIDVIHPWHHAEELAGLVPGAELVRITPKAENRERYVADMRAALASFLKGHFR